MRHETLPDSFRRIGADVLQRSGVHAASKLMAGIRFCLTGNRSMNSTVGWADSMPSSTFSTRLRDVQLVALTAAMNEWFRSSAVEALRELPPDAEVICSIDCHEQEYYRSRSRNRKIPDERSRQPWSLRSASENKRTYWCQRWLGIVLSWEHARVPVVVPIHFQLLSGLDHQPSNHARRAVEALQLMAVKPSIVLADSGYDSPGFRAVLRDAGLDFIVRTNLGTQDAGRTFAPAHGERQRITSLMDEVVDKQASPVLYEARHRGRPPYAYFAHNLQGSLQTDPGHLTLTLKVGLNPPEGTRKKVAWTRDPSVCMALISNVDVSASTIIDLYRQRHRIETFYEHLTLDSWGARPKTITHHAVAFFLKVAAVATAIRLSATQRVRQRLPPASRFVPRSIRAWVDRLLDVPRQRRRETG